MTKDTQDTWVCLIIMSLGIFGTSIITGYIIQDKLKDRAAETSCAQYNSRTGDFEWLEK